MNKLYEKTLEVKYLELANEYISEFEKQIDIEFEYWLNECYTCCFGDYYLDFSDIKKIVDNKIDSDTFFGWYNFNLYYHRMQVDVYNIKRQEYRKETPIDCFEEKDFQLKILSDMVKNY